MSKNTMFVNGKEVEYTDAQMRDFWESYVEGLSKSLSQSKANYARDRREVFQVLEEIAKYAYTDDHNGEAGHIAKSYLDRLKERESK